MRPGFPALTLLLVPILAILGRTREPEAPVVCPPEGRLEPDGRMATLPGAPAGASWDEGLRMEPGARLVLELPAHHGRIAVRIRADHNDVYVIEAPLSGGWREVGRFSTIDEPGLQSRPWEEVLVGHAPEIRIVPRDGDGVYSVALVCVRGPRWPVPLFLPLGVGLALVFIGLRAVPSDAAHAVLRTWVRLDPALAFGLALALLDPPIGALAIAPATWALTAWRTRRAGGT